MPLTKLQRAKLRGRARAMRAIKKRGYRPRLNRNLIVYGMPRSQLVRMVYTDQIRLDPGEGGTPASFVFRANSVYDPQYTTYSPSTGGRNGQCLFHDTYAEIYQHFKVVGSKISLICANDYSETNSTMGNLVSCVVNNVPTAYTSYNEATEAKGCKYIQVHEKRTSKLKQTYSAKDFHNKVDVKDNEDLQGNLVASGGTTLDNPTAQAYYVINAFPLYFGQNSYPTCINVRIEYLTLVYDMRKMQGS